MKKYILLFGLFVTVSQAAIVKSSSLFNIDGTPPDALVLASAGGTISSGFASSGVFSLTDLQVTTLANTFATSLDITSLKSAFNGFLGSDDFQTGVDFLFNTGDISGAYAFQSASFNPTAFIGQSLYTFIGDGVDLDSSTEFALYRHTTTLTADSVSPTPENTYDLLLTGGTLLIGGPTTSFLSTDANLGTDGDTVNAIQLVSTIPEPSALLLSAFGVLGLLRRKR